MVNPSTPWISMWTRAVEVMASNRIYMIRLAVFPAFRSVSGSPQAAVITINPIVLSAVDLWVSSEMADSSTGISEAPRHLARIMFRVIQRSMARLQCDHNDQYKSISMWIRLWIRWVLLTRPKIEPEMWRRLISDWPVEAGGVHLRNCIRFSRIHAASVRPSSIGRTNK